MSDDLRTLFGPLIPGDMASFLLVGFQELPLDRQGELVDNVRRAQEEAAGASLLAALESDRVSEVCPDTPDEFLNPSVIRFRISKGDGDVAE
jgi:hypothetical protein